MTLQGLLVDVLVTAKYKNRGGHRDEADETRNERTWSLRCLTLWDIQIYHLVMTNSSPCFILFNSRSAVFTDLYMWVFKRKCSVQKKHGETFCLCGFIFHYFTKALSASPQKTAGWFLLCHLCWASKPKNAVCFEKRFGRGEQCRESCHEKKSWKPTGSKMCLNGRKTYNWGYLFRYFRQPWLWWNSSHETWVEFALR